MVIGSSLSLGCGGGTDEPRSGSGGSGGGAAGYGGANVSGSGNVGGAGVTGAAGSAISAGADAGGGGSASSGGGSGNTGGGGGGGGAGAVNGVAPVVAAGVRWIGRVDVSDAAAIKFAWSGTGFVGKLSGSEVSVRLRTDGAGDVFFQPVIDGKPGTRFSVGATEKTVSLATGLAAGEHEIALVRETEGKGFGTTVFLGFAAGTPAAPPTFSGRLIEVVGDSISAGFGNLGSEQHPNYGPDPNGGCDFTTETESAYSSYAQIAARALGADASVLAGSGWGAYSDNIGNTKNVMSALFDYTLGQRATPTWSFAAQPQAVVMNLGTNDSSAMNLTADKFQPAYAAFASKVREKYPDALLLFAVGSMLGNAEHQTAITLLNAVAEARAAQGDTKVKVLDLGAQDALKGTGCAWHPNVAEHERMGGLLVKELKSSLGW